MVRWQSLTLVVLLAVTAIADDDAAALGSKADAAYAAGDYATAAQLYQAAVEAGGPPVNHSYNAACCFALIGKPDDAFVWLNKSIDAGWRDVDHLQADTDFNSLHEDPRWAAAVKHCEQALAEYLKTIKLPELRAELLKRMREDQRVRLQPKPDMAEWRRIDADNLKYIKGVIEEHGWPGNDMVGTDGAQAAFLLVQHAASDLPFQKKCLELLKKAVQAKQARPDQMALLTDRVLMLEGKPQIYGSQMIQVNGEIKLAPIEDEEHVDQRRKEVGLEPLVDYLKRFQQPTTQPTTQP